METPRIYKTFHDQALLVQFRGDEDILVEMIDLFLKSIQDFLNPIREAIIAKDQQKLKLHAHNLKGGMSNFYANYAQEMAKEMEDLADAQLFHEAHFKLNEIENNLVVLFYELTHFKKKLNGQSLF